MENLKISPGAARLGVPSAGVNRTLVVVNAPAQQLSALRAACGTDDWKVSSFRTYREAMTELSLERAQVIACNSRLPDGTWEDILSGTASQTLRPRLIVLLPQTDERLWGEVVNMGGFDVLAGPFAEEDARRVLDAASRDWCDEACKESWRRGYLAATG